MRKANLRPIFRAALALLCLAASAGGQLRRDAGAALTDAEFWQIFSKMSESGGSFPSENFVSNEVSFQYPIPMLQKTVRSDGVYLGVGPEQNFTYIANLKPRLAIIFDIRRQNAMAHLMYKAMFELSPTRADFVSRLFSRPLVARVAAGVGVDNLFAVAGAAERSDSAFRANQRAVFATLVDKHRFALTPGDSAGIEHLLEVFYEAGPEVNYGYRLGRGGFTSTYPTYAMLQTRSTIDSVQLAFLASEDLYRAVRDMQVRNLIVPVVADFAGPTGIRAVGDYLKQRNLTVQAFYLSNVEQYLFQNGVSDMFYQNVATLPLDSTSTFIRSVPPGGGGAGMVATGSITGGSVMIRSSISNGVGTTLTMFDSVGYRWTRTTTDSGSTSLTRLYRDSSGVMQLRQSDTTRRASSVPMPTAPIWIGGGGTVAPVPGRAPQLVFGGGLLTSGIASMKKTVDAFNAGNAKSYRDIIQMTKFDGWK